MKTTCALNFKSTRLVLCLFAVLMMASVQSINQPDCLQYSDPSAVTTLVSDASTSDTLIQTIEIAAGATCRFTNTGST